MTTTSLITRAAEGMAMLGGIILFAIVTVTTVNSAGFALDKIARLWGGSVSGLPGFEDIVTLLVAPAIILFFPYCQLRMGHVAVEFFTARLPQAARRTMDRTWAAGMGLTALFLLYWLPLAMLDNRADGAVSRVLGWTEWPFFIPGFFALALWAAICFAQVAGTLEITGEPDV